MERRVALESWDTLWSVGESGEDSLLLYPLQLAAWDSGVYVYDQGAYRVLAFDRDGTPRWSYGGRGKGPDEFDKVRDLKVTAGGDVLVLDPRNNRITQLTRRGRVVTRVPLTETGYVDQIAPLHGDRLLLMTMNPDSAFIVVNKKGKVEDRFTLSWKGFAALDPLARQGMIAASPGTEQWAFGFSIGNGWFSYAGQTPQGFVGRYAEHTDFPKVDTSPGKNGMNSELTEYNACSGCNLAIAGDTLYVQFGGYTPLSKSVLDLFDMRTGAYLGSYRLPVRPSAISVVGDRVYAIVEEPAPMLLALRPRRGTGT